MSSPQDLLSRMQDFCGFIERLSDLSAELLLSPMAKGKWSVQETVAHIMAYDETFLQSVVIAIEDGKQPLMPDPADNQPFNDRAAALGRKLTKGQLLDRATRARQQLVDHLRRLPVQAFQMNLEKTIEHNLAELLYGDFVSHDRMHLKQIEEYLNSRGYSGIALPGGDTTP